MATTDSGAAAPSSAAPSDDDDKSCFICLQTATETPDAVWVTPCPCSIDAHEECMLQWIAGIEATKSGRNSTSKKIRCPVCNARIRTIDQHDSLVELGDRLLGAYKRTTPAMLGSIVSAMGVAGSSFYGFQSLSVFAGGAEAGEWLLRGMPDMTVGHNLDSIIDMAAGVTSIGGGGGRMGILSGHAWWAFGVVNKMVLLNLLAPGLLLYRMLPSAANVVALPVSLIYGATLVSRNKWPTWPPSPVWAMVAMPTVSIAYSTAYYDLFGGLERRLNRALMGRPEQDEPQELRAPPAVGGGGGEAKNNNAAANNAAPAPDEGGGILAPLHRFRFFLAELAGQDDHDHDHEHDHNHVHVHGGAEDDFALPDNVGPENIALQVNNDDGFIQVAVDIAIEEIVEEVDTDEEEDNNNVAAAAANIDDDEILPPRQVRDDDMNILGEVAVGDRGVDDDDNDAALPPPDIRRLRPAVDLDAEIVAAVAGADDENGPAHLHPDVMQGPALAEALAGGPPADAPPPANNGGGLFVSDIIAAVTTQLLLPQVASAIGNILFVTLPRSWVVPPAPEVPVAVAAVSWWSMSTKTMTKSPKLPLPSGTVRRGLLMEKWGRSLVGGLLWIVLRDAWSLYIKYRRVQMKKQRKIKNVDRKKRNQPNNEEETTTETTAA